MIKKNQFPATVDAFDLPKGAIAAMFRRRDQLRADLSAIEHVLKIFYHASENGNGYAPEPSPVLNAAIALDAQRRERLAAKADDHPEQRARERKRRKAEQAARRKRTAAYLAQFRTGEDRAPSPMKQSDNRSIGSLIASGYLKRGKKPGTYRRTAKPFTAYKGANGAGKGSSVWFAKRDGTITEARKSADRAAKRTPGGDMDQREARRARSKALLDTFDETTPKKPAPGYLDAKFLGPLLRRGYLKKAPGDAGYLRTGKVFTVEIRPSA